jgi:hypothetical protein
VSVLVPKFQEFYTDADREAYFSIIAARDGDYTRLRQRIRDKTATQKELELNAAILAELQTTRKVKTPKAKTKDAMRRNDLAFSVLFLEARSVDRATAVKSTQERFRAGRNTVYEALAEFESDLEKMAAARVLITKLLTIPETWDPANSVVSVVLGPSSG